MDIDSKIHLNKRVKHIRWSITGEEQTNVECDDGSQYKVDHVICTMSVGVLKAHHETMFSPELFTSHRKAIQGIKLGTVNKIYIEFAESFWTENWDGLVCLWCDADLAELRANPDESWAEGIFSFTTVQYHRNLLCGWISGPFSREMETKSDAVVKKVVTKWIRRFLGNRVVADPIAIKRLGFYNNICDLFYYKKKHVIFYRSRWSSEPNFLGSYSYKSLEGHDMAVRRCDLAEPLLNYSDHLVVQFAGEASESEYFSTVHGAVATGWREAQRLIDFYKN